MTTDFRALCAELLDEAIYLGSLPYEQDPDPDLIVRARAALALLLALGAAVELSVKVIFVKLLPLLLRLH
jgi:hypothetical protein